VRKSLKIISFLAFVISIFSIFAANAKAHTGVNVLEDCDVYLEYGERPLLTCRVYASVLNATGIANSIDTNANSNFEQEEISKWIDQKYVPNITLKINDKVMNLKLFNTEFPSYVDFSSAPDQTSLAFAFEIIEPIDPAIFSIASNIEFISKTDIDKTQVKSFTLNPASNFYIDIDKYDPNQLNKFCIIPIKLVDTLVTIPSNSCAGGSATPTPISPSQESSQAPVVESKGFFTKLGETFDSWVNNIPGQSSKFVDKLKSFFSNKTFFGLLIILFISLLVGAAHALTPGHGKAFISAVLIHDSQDSMKKAFILGIGLALSHTISVIIIGIAFVVLEQTRILDHEIFVHIFTITSFVLIILIGMNLFRNRYKEIKSGKNEITIGPLGMEKNPFMRNLDFKKVFMSGVSGGIAPCAEALVVLFLAIKQKEFLWGSLIVVAFSLGIAIALVGFGILVVKAKKLGMKSKRIRTSKVINYLPIISSIFITLLGFYLLFDYISKSF
jgi:ABC-type nickel/cobalt efflux system permease component RcnA